MSGPAQGVVGVILVDLVKVFKDRGALDIQRRDRAHQIPKALVVVLHLPLAAEEVALLWVLDAVETAAGDLARLVDGDAFAVHLPVADQKARRRERGDATADEIGRLLVHALRLAGTNECFVVTITVEHICLSPLFHNCFDSCLNLGQFCYLGFFSHVWLLNILGCLFLIQNLQKKKQGNREYISIMFSNASLLPKYHFK